MKTLIFYLFLIVFGLVVGGYSALSMSGLIGEKSSVRFAVTDVNGWGGDPSIGSSSANPYVRARVARHGLLALAKEEAVYFTASRDSRGDKLSEDCIYELTGGQQDADWWSITLYNNDSRLPMNDDDALSIDATKTAGRETWSAIISAERPDNAAAWISSRSAGIFDLTLRLYRPSLAVLDDPERAIHAPSVIRKSCGAST